MSEEWGPWVEHDGKGCPCRGMIVESEQADGLIEIHIADGVSRCAYTGKPKPRTFNDVDLWNWMQCRTSVPSRWDKRIIRYRIRKPRALLDMIERAAKLDRVKETT